ncbi:MAG: hypothetical protein GXY64_05105 [Bacteroidales bacterium]|nr:hypothetical protein [Bacteroidales bacterium]
MGKSFSKHIITLLLFGMASSPLWSQEPQAIIQPQQAQQSRAEDHASAQNQPLMPGESPRPTKYIAVEEQKEHLVFFQGFTLSADLFGPIAYLVSDYGTAEAALRLNLKNTFFPIVEMGVGKCKKEDFNTKVTYDVKAPYARVGFDLNMLKNKFQSNRLYLGARYGISNFKYDISGPAQTDPIWGGSESFNQEGIKCTSHWAELVFGVEVKIMKNFHMGWSVRYKTEIASTKSDYSKPHCIPGYGYTTNSTCWGGTYNLIFDLNWGMKRSHKRGVRITSGNIPAQNTPTKENKDIEEDKQESHDEGATGTGNEGADAESANDSGTAE